ncbi:MAG: putative manganese-dependent inorganic diphosphatase, partial [Chloroflexota bacterium]|nr:putative manganese-dependent inorganic diphosphatase [Chloroflexota bacterium]
HHLIGVITLDDVAARYLQEMDLASGIQSRISFESMIRTLDGELVAGDSAGDWHGRVWVAAMQAETMCRLIEPGDLVVAGDRANAQEAALDRGAGCLVLVGNARLAQPLLDDAQRKGVRVIVTPHDSYRVTRLLNLSVSVADVMRRDIATADGDDLASEAEESLGDRGTIALPVVDADGRLVGVVSRTDLLRARGKGVILVDHNHSAQAVEGLEQARLLEVIDHHNLGDLHTPEPIYMKLEPVGSTSTIVAELYQQHGVQPEGSIAGLLVGGIISDTLLFRSPTCTPRDRAAAEWLRKLADVNLDELAYSMFRENSNYEDKTPADIIGSNLKVYEWGGRKVGIGQAETVQMEYFTEHQDAFRAEMSRLKESQGWQYAFFLATDILSQTSVMLLPGEGERDLAQRAFQVRPENGSVVLPGIVSRKKQIVPPLARELS